MINSKICTVEQAARVARLAKATYKRVVLVTGVFDLIHSEHINFLKRALNAGSVLLVGLESDDRVRRMKGETRPIYPLHQRILQLECLGIATIVFALPDSFDLPIHHEELIEQLRPDILAISSHTLHQDKKQKLMEKYGGELRVVHQHNPLVSTSQVLKDREKLSKVS